MEISKHLTVQSSTATHSRCKYIGYAYMQKQPVIFVVNIYMVGLENLKVTIPVLSRQGIDGGRHKLELWGVL